MLRRVFFLQPLLLDGDVAQLRVVCELNAAEERFEVRSELTEEGASTAHCGGSTGAAPPDDERRRPQPAAVRGSCGAAVSAADLYSAFRGMGLEYGPAYRTLAGMWASPASGAAVGQLRRRRRLQGTSVHPADLDGALQLTALLATGAASEVRLPFSVESAALRGARGHLCPVAERQSASTTRVALVSQSRRGGGGAHLSGFETRALKAGCAEEAPAMATLNVTAWTARALSADAGPEAAAASSLVLSGAVSSVVSGAGATRATAAGGPRSVAFAAGVGGARAERDSLAVMAAAFDIVRAHTAKVALPVWLLTSRAFGARPSGGSGASAHAGMMGLARQVRSEAPTCRLPVIDLDAAAAVAGSAAAAAMLGLGYSGLPEPEVAFDAGRPRVPRLAEAPGSISGPVRMHFDARGAVSNLRIVPQAEESSPPADGEVELRVRAVGLNFRDVLNVLGVYPGDPGPPGSDCAADVARCGGGAPHLRVGDAVLGHGLAALASFARSDSRLMAVIDDSLMEIGEGGKVVLRRHRELATTACAD